MTSKRVAFRDSDFACQYYEHSWRYFPRLLEILALDVRAYFPKPMQSFNVNRFQLGKHLVTSGFGNRSRA
jgi:hypothetical protein